MKKPHIMPAGELTGAELGEWVTMEIYGSYGAKRLEGGLLTSIVVREYGQGVDIILGGSDLKQLGNISLVTIWRED